VPEVSGPAVFVVLAVAAVAVGLAAASLVAALRGERLDDSPVGRHRGAAVVVAFGYLVLAALIVFAIREGSLR
jgi:hypothetical protein